MTIDGSLEVKPARKGATAERGGLRVRKAVSFKVVIGKARVPVIA